MMRSVRNHCNIIFEMIAMMTLMKLPSTTLSSTEACMQALPLPIRSLLARPPLSSTDALRPRVSCSLGSESPRSHPTPAVSHRDPIRHSIGAYEIAFKIESVNTTSLTALLPSVPSPQDPDLYPHSCSGLCRIAAPIDHTAELLSIHHPA